MSVNIAKDRQTGRLRGIAFVEMSTQWEGRRAAFMLNRTDFMGENLLVKEAIVRSDFRGEIAIELKDSHHTRKVHYE